MMQSPAPKKTAISVRLNHYTFRSVLAQAGVPFRDCNHSLYLVMFTMRP